MPSALTGAAVCLLVLALWALVLAWGALRQHRWIKGGCAVIIGVLLLKCGTLGGVISVATRGYRELSAEQLAATLRTEPLPDNKHFHATIVLPGQPVAMYDLAGTVFSIDAVILRWHSVLSPLGLRTAYRLDRVAGRDKHAAFSLSQAKALDMFQLVKTFPLLTRIVDAEQASATVTVTGRPANFDVLVSTTGLVIRPAAP